jgi:hypothetical protein
VRRWCGGTRIWPPTTAAMRTSSANERARILRMCPSLSQGAILPNFRRNENTQAGHFTYRRASIPYSFTASSLNSRLKTLLPIAHLRLHHYTLTRCPENRGQAIRSERNPINDRKSAEAA